jgi:hypothetical protein
MYMLWKDFLQTNGPSLVGALPSVGKNWLTRRPAILRPHAFSNGAVVPQLPPMPPMPKDNDTPTLNFSSINIGTALSSRKCGNNASAWAPESLASIRTLILPVPCSGKLDPGITFRSPICILISSNLTKTLPGVDVRISIPYGLGFVQVTSICMLISMLLAPSESSSKTARWSPHSVAV